MNAYRLTLSHPATEWENATPIGNGVYVARHTGL